VRSLSGNHDSPRSLSVRLLYAATVLLYGRSTAVMFATQSLALYGRPAHRQRECRRAPRSGLSPLSWACVGARQGRHASACRRLRSGISAFHRWLKCSAAAQGRRAKQPGWPAGFFSGDCEACRPTPPRLPGSGCCPRSLDLSLYGYAGYGLPLQECDSREIRDGIMSATNSPSMWKKMRPHRRARFRSHVCKFCPTRMVIAPQ